MERNPLIVVSSRLDGVRDEVRGKEKSQTSIVTAGRRAKEAAETDSDDSWSH